MEQKKKTVYRMDFWIPFLLFSLLFLFKILAVIENRTMPLIFDEFKYEKMSRLLLTKGGYHSVQYPLFYPLALMPAYLFGEHYYVAMKVLNCLYSSFVPVLAYLICRLYLKETPSGICAAFSAVIPFHYITPMSLMSENLYFPMFLLAVYLTLRKHKRELLGDLALGVTLGLMFMTRHITLVVIPVFALVWIMKQKELGKKWGTIFGRGFLIVAALGIAYSPWVYNGIKGGYSLKMIVGFSIASKTNPEQLTLARLVQSGAYYVGYFVLILAPVLGLAIRSLRALDLGLKKVCSAYNQLWVIVFGLAGAFFVAVTRHSWRAYYNYPEFAKLKGRYIIYFTVLFVILAAVVLFQKKPKFKHRWLNVALTYVLPAALIIISYLVEVKQVWHTLPGGFIDTYECSDMRKIYFMGGAFVLIVPFVSWIYQYIADFGKEKYKKYLPAVFAAVILAVELWGAAPYLSMVHRGNERAKETNQRYANEMAATLTQLYEGKRMFVLGENLPNAKIMPHVPIFYHLDRVLLSDDRADIKAEQYYILTDQPEKYEAITEEKIAQYEWEEKNYEMILVDESGK